MEPLLNNEIDNTIPLRFERYGEHLGCGGIVERAVYYGETFCILCGRTVPNKQVGVVLDSPPKIGYNSPVQ